MSKIIQLQHAAKLYGGDGIVAEVVTITPQSATNWLRANKRNRPVRRSHVTFLASEILAGNWQVNGQAIVISPDENVLDGQHRLLAIIQAGQQIQTLVVYGIAEDAFKTIDTGAVRSASDAVCLEHCDLPVSIVHSAANAVKWCMRLETGNLKGFKKVSNTDVLKYVNKHQSLVECATTLQAYPHEARPLAISIGTACFEMFSRKSEDQADEFMRRFYTGEGLERTDVEYLLRNAFIRDATRSSKIPAPNKVRMLCKAWNWHRRGMPKANANVIAIHPNDSPEVKLL